MASLLPLCVNLRSSPSLLSLRLFLLPSFPPSLLPSFPPSLPSPSPSCRDNFRFWESYKASIEAMLARDRAFVENNEHLSDEAKAEQLADFEKNEKHWR